MFNLKEKVVNCYLQFLTQLNYGIVRDYNLLYAAVLYLKNDIDESRYEQYLYNNLNCNKEITLTETSTTHMIIGNTLNSSSTLLETFEWNELSILNTGLYTITTTPKSGFNYLYISVPTGLTPVIYDSMGDNITSSFNYVGEVITSLGKKNDVYKKDNVFNSSNSIQIKVSI